MHRKTVTHNHLTTQELRTKSKNSTWSHAYYEWILCELLACVNGSLATSNCIRWVRNKTINIEPLNSEKCHNNSIYRWEYVRSLSNYRATFSSVSCGYRSSSLAMTIFSRKLIELHNRFNQHCQLIAYGDSFPNLAKNQALIISIKPFKHSQHDKISCSRTTCHNRSDWVTFWTNTNKTCKTYDPHNWITGFCFSLMIAGPSSCRQRMGDI